LKLPYDDGDQHTRGDGASDLHLHRVLAVADESLDTQMLLDPFEGQFGLLSALVQRSDRQCRQVSLDVPVAPFVGIGQCRALEWLQWLI
jgi:hypothetical protein